MFSLYLAFLLGCPASLETNQQSRDTTIHESSPPPVLGVNERADCDQTAIGSNVCNLVLLDHNNDIWELYDLEGKVIILDFSTSWCGPCVAAAAHVQRIQDDYGEQIVFATLLVQGLTGLPATQQDVIDWKTAHGMTTAPVLQASRDYVMDPTGITGYLVGGYPTYVYIDQNLIIHTGHVGFSEEYMRITIDGLL